MLWNDVTRISRDKLRSNTVQFLAHVVIVEALDLLRLTRGRAKRYARPRQIQLVHLHAGVNQRQFRRDDRKLRRASQVSCIQVRHIIRGAEILHLSSQMNVEAAGVERLHCRGPRPAGEHVLPELLAPGADRGHHSNSSNYNPVIHTQAACAQRYCSTTLTVSLTVRIADRSSSGISILNWYSASTAISRMVSESSFKSSLYDAFSVISSGLMLVMVAMDFFILALISSVLMFGVSLFNLQSQRARKGFDIGVRSRIRIEQVDLGCLKRLAPRGTSSPPNEAFGDLKIPPHLSTEMDFIISSYSSRKVDCVHWGKAQRDSGNTLSRRGIP